MSGFGRLSGDVRDWLVSAKSLEGIFVRSLFRWAGWLTLLFVAYLLLSMLALARMKSHYHHWLPPLGWDSVSSVPRPVLLVAIFWVALLAMGCLVNSRRKVHRPRSPRSS